MEIEGLRDLQKIGEGGYSEVYRGFEIELDQYVAAKVLTKRLGSDQVRKQFAAEVKSMGRVANHPAIVKVHRTTVTSTRHPVIIMEYLSGGTLAAGGKSLQQVLSAGVMISSALSWIHGHGSLHNDVKPSNVLLSQFGEPKLGDFGVSALISVDGTSEIVGLSFEFAPPEAIAGNPGPLGDVYALAGTLYCALSGAFPLQRLGEDAERISDIDWVGRIENKHTRPVPLSEYGLAPAVDDLIVGAGLARSPANRPTAEEFGLRLRELESRLGFPSTAWPESSAPAHVVRSPTSNPDPKIEKLDDASERGVADGGGKTQTLHHRQASAVQPPPESESEGFQKILRKARELDVRILATAGGITAALILVGLLVLGRGAGPPPPTDSSFPAVVPTLEAPTLVVAPENLRIKRVGDGTAVVSWTDRNTVPPIFELQFIDESGALSRFEQTEMTEFTIPAIADIDAPCLVLRAIGERGRISSDAGPVCLDPKLGDAPIIAVVPRSCAPGACDFRIEASNFSADQTASIRIVGPDGVDINAEFGGAYETTAAVRLDGSINWFFDPGPAATLGVYTVEVTDNRTALSSVGIFQLSAA